MPKIIITVKNLKIQPDYLKILSRDQAINNIRGVLEIEYDDRYTLSACDFYVVEFTEQLSAWLESDNGEFCFESVNDSREELVVFRRLTNAWKIEALDCWEMYNGQFIFHDKELRNACKLFIEDIKCQLDHKFDIQIWKYCKVR